MSVENPYEQLGIPENATFDEIQTARNRLTQEYSNDPKRQEAIETAYDAILMERLRMRQEGRIPVPEGIRFAEQRFSQTPPSPPPISVKQPPAWLQGFLDTPSRADILWTTGAFLVLAGLGFYQPSFALALGVFASLYFLTRKERKLGRSVLLSLAGLTLGLVLWGVLASLLTTQINNLPMPLTGETLAAWISFMILWLVSAFLR
ncbi:CPP1-like family protein [Aerosakkonemataceae cyanobacterium BLCC-F154]|uniref:CPP1-like family protein n=1 Tax=Floridaenema fluviatile BLCC-F154 TaxID=3153640 RepID=A0ABV4YHC9_9CYAN